MAKINPVPAESLKVTMAQSKAWIERTARQAVSSMSAPTAEPQSKKYEEQHLYRAIKKACPPIEGLKKGNVYYANVEQHDEASYVRVVLKHHNDDDTLEDERGVFDLSSIKSEFTVVPEQDATVSYNGHVATLVYTRYWMENHTNRVTILIKLPEIWNNPKVYVRYVDGMLVIVPSAFCVAPTLPEPDYSNLFLSNDRTTVHSEYRTQVQYRTTRVLSEEYKNKKCYYLKAKKKTWGKSHTGGQTKSFDYSLRLNNKSIFRIRYATKKKKSRWRVVSINPYEQFVFLT